MTNTNTGNVFYLETGQNVYFFRSKHPNLFDLKINKFYEMGVSIRMKLNASVENG